MKKLFIILILTLFCFINSFGQRLTVNELISLFDYNSDDLDTYLIKKGFEFSPSTDDNIKTDCKYFYEYSYKLKSYYDFASFHCIYDNYTYSLNFRTPSSHDYLLFKSELKTYGFKFIKVYDDDNVHFIEYEFITNKYNYRATLATRLIDEKLTIYELSINKSSK